MSNLPSELEILRDNVERIDRTLDQSENLQRALYDASNEYYHHQLSLVSDTVANQAFIAEEVGGLSVSIADVGADITAGLSYVEDRLERIGDVHRSGLRKVVGTIEALGPLFQWGFDQVVCQIAMAGEDIRKIVQALQKPLDTQAKELRARGFEAMNNMWYDEALKDLLVSEEKNYRDFTVLRAIASIFLTEQKDFSSARAYYEKAAKYAEPYSLVHAAEDHLGASVACRQLQEFLEAYKHTLCAATLNRESLVVRYERAINSVCLSQSTQIPSDRSAESLIAEALEQLRTVLWADEDYTVRVDTELCFALIRDRCRMLLEELRQDRAGKADKLLSEIDRSIADLEAYCTPVWFRSFASEEIKERTHLQALRTRAGVLELVEVIQRVPSLKSDLERVRAKAARLYEFQGYADKLLKDIDQSLAAGKKIWMPDRFTAVAADILQRRATLQHLRNRDTLAELQELCDRAPKLKNEIKLVIDRGEHLNTVEEETNRKIAELDGALASARVSCGVERFVTLGADIIQERATIDALCNERTVESLQRAGKRSDELKAASNSIPSLVVRADEEMQKVAFAHEFARQFAPDGRWPDQAAQFDAEFSTIRNLFETNTRPAYTQLLTLAPSLQQRLCAFCEGQLSTARNIIAGRIEEASATEKSHSTKLQTEAVAAGRRATDKKVQYYTLSGCLFIPTYLVIGLTIAILTGTSTAPFVPVLGLIFTGLLLFGISATMAGARKQEAEDARTRAEIYSSSEIPALKSLLKDCDESISRCRRRESFELPPSIRKLFPL